MWFITLLGFLLLIGSFLTLDDAYHRRVHLFQTIAGVFSFILGLFMVVMMTLKYAGVL